MTYPNEQTADYRFEHTDIGQLFIRGTTVTTELVHTAPSWSKLLALDCQQVQFVEANLDWLREQKSLLILRLDQTNFQDDGCPSVSQLERLRRLTISDARLTNQGLRELKQVERRGEEKLPFLRLLNLAGNRGITDLGLITIGTLFNKLSELNVSGTQIADWGLIALEKLTKLVTLDLTRTPITDAGLVHLIAVPSLRMLYLEKKSVKAKRCGLAQLKQHNPNLTVVFKE